MTAGQHTLVVEYYKIGGSARFYFDFRKAPIEETDEVLPPTSGGPTNTPDPSPTSSPTGSQTATPSATITPTPSNTPTMTPSPTPTNTPSFGQWSAWYFNNTTAEGLPAYVEVLPGAINFNWGASSPHPGIIADDNFSALFGSEQAFSGKVYRFTVTSDDGVKVLIDGIPVLDRYVGRPLTTDTFYYRPTAGAHFVYLQYFEGIDQAAIQFFWEEVDVSVEADVTLEGRTTPPGSAWVVPLHAMLIPDGEAYQIWYQDFMTDQWGRFNFGDDLPGTYRLWVKPTNMLASTQMITVGVGDNAVNLGLLRGGDANDDNAVTIADFAILANTFGRTSGQAGYDARADFNGDGAVTIADFSLLALNFGQVGAASSAGGS